MKKEEKTRYDELKDLIISCIDPEFKPIKGFIIPFERSVIVKKNKNTSVTLESGIIMSDTGAANVRTPNIGTVIAIGPQTPDYIVPGLKVYFNQNVDLEYLIGGGYYHMMDFSDIFAAIPENTFVSMDVKDERELSREKGIADESSYKLRKEAHDANNEDKTAELIKKLGNKFNA